MVEKATELGAWSILPLETERSTLRGSGAPPGSKGKKKSKTKTKTKEGDDVGCGEEVRDASDPEPASGLVGREKRWRRLVVAANQQSLRAHATKIEPTVCIHDWVVGPGSGSLSGYDLVLLAAAGGAPLAEVLRRPVHRPALSDVGKVLVVVGPEGDFTPEEQAELVAAGATLVGLGPLRLRVETAVLAALATVRLYADGGV